MKSLDEELNRMLIKEPLERYLKTNEPEDMLMLLANISVRINDNGTAPSPMTEATRIVLGFDPDMELENLFSPDDEPVRTSCIITDEDGDTWLPLFTGRGELGNFAKNYTITDRPVLDIITEAFNDSSITGLVIDPCSNALSLKKELLYVILHLLDKEESEAG